MVDDSTTTTFGPGASPRIKRLVAQIADKHQVTVREILGKRRYPRIVKARWEAISCAHKETGYSLPKLGAIFHKHHTTIFNALRNGKR